MRRLVCLFGFLGMVPFCTGMQSEEIPTASGSVRFLCVRPDLPPKYKRLENGAYVAVPYDFGEAPPPMVHRRRGAEYWPVPFNPNGLSPSEFFPAKAKIPIGDYYVQDTGASVQASLDAEGQVKPDPIKPPGAVKNGKEIWHAFAKGPPCDGKDYLIFVFQPRPEARWFPPRTVTVDISREAFPLDRCLVFNATGMPLLVALDLHKKPLAVKPDGAFAISSANPENPGQVTLRIAAGAGSTMRVAYNRETDLPEGSRLVVVVYPMRDNSGVGVRLYSLGEG